MNLTVPLQQLYDQDYFDWLTQTTQYLKTKQLDKIDYENLIEELESLGREQKKKVDSYLRQLRIHLLLYTYWTAEKKYFQQG